jgi:hypothetical protein
MDNTGPYPVLGNGDKLNELSTYTTQLALKVSGTGAAFNSGYSEASGGSRFVPNQIGTSVANLNTFTKTGVYHQARNVDALTSLNYPSANAGLLEVFADGDMVYQRYSAYRNTNQMYVRGSYQGTWMAWKQISV